MQAVLLKFEVSEEEKERYQKDWRHVRRWLLFQFVCTVFVWGANLLFPSGSVLVYLDAFVCVVTAVLLWHWIVRARWMRLQLAGWMTTTHLPDPIGLVRWFPPRKEGCHWKVVQWPKPKFFSFVTELVLPQGRGPTPGQALFDLMTKFDDRLEQIPKEAIADLLHRMDQDFAETMVVVEAPQDQ